MKLYKRNGEYIVNGYKPTLQNDMYLDCDKNNYIDVDVKEIDVRSISDNQRKFIFALCDDIGSYIGQDKEYYRLLMQQYNANLRGIEVESLSSCSMTYANGLIDTIINFCIEKEIPINGETLNEHGYTFDEKQTYMLCLKRICCVCGKYADIHHVDHIGTRINRKKNSHVGLRALPLCRVHHNEVHNTGEEKFINMYHLSPITIDEKMDLFIRKGLIKEY